MWQRVRESAPRTMMPLCGGERERRGTQSTLRNGNQWSLFSPGSKNLKTLTHTHGKIHTQTDDDENHILPIHSDVNHKASSACVCNYSLRNQANDSHATSTDPQEGIARIRREIDAYKAEF